jgi:hypothetical protein
MISKPFPPSSLPFSHPFLSSTHLSPFFPSHMYLQTVFFYILHSSRRLRILPAATLNHFPPLLQPPTFPPIYRFSSHLPPFFPSLSLYPVQGQFIHKNRKEKEFILIGNECDPPVWLRVSNCPNQSHLIMRSIRTAIYLPGRTCLCLCLCLCHCPPPPTPTRTEFHKARAATKGHNPVRENYKCQGKNMSLECFNKSSRPLGSVDFMCRKKTKHIHI